MIDSIQRPLDGISDQRNTVRLQWVKSSYFTSSIKKTKQAKNVLNGLLFK